MPPKAPAVAVNVGKVRATGIRPPNSQTARTARTGPARSNQVCAARGSPPHAPGRRPAPAAGAARPLPVTAAMPSGSVGARRLERALQRPEIPEILDVQAGGIALHLTDEAVELEIGPGRLLASAIGGEHSLGTGLLVVRDDLLLELRLKILGQAEPLTLLGGEVGVLDDRVPRVQRLLEQHLRDLLVRREPLGVRHERLVRGADVRQWQLVESVRRLVLDEVPARDVEEGGSHVALKERGRPNLRAGHVADLAE